MFQLPWMPYILLSSMDFTFLSTVFKPAMSQKHFNEEDVNAFKYNMKSYGTYTYMCNVPMIYKYDISSTILLITKPN